MLKRNEVCEMLGIDYPIIQAPMGPYITTNLAAAVSNAGGYGVISHSGTIELLRERDPEALKAYQKVIGVEDVDKLSKVMAPSDRGPIEEIEKVAEMTDKPFGVNIRVAKEQVDTPYLMEALFELREDNPKIREQLTSVITSAGNPELFTDEFKEAGLTVIHVVPSVYHAKKARDAGVDAVVASGHEAGGHIAWEPVHSSVLLPAVVDAVGKDIPVLSAGGWSDGRGLAAILAMGGQAIYMGTRFINTKESDFSDGYKEALLDADERETIVAPCMLGRARYMENEYSRNLEELTKEIGGIETGKIPREVIEYESKHAKYRKSYIHGETDKYVVFGGEVQGRIDDIPTVEELVQRIVKEAEEVISEMPDRHLSG